MSNFEGYLDKKGEGWSGLGLTTAFRTKKRWCVLDAKSRELSFYKDRGSEVRQGFVDLATARRVETGGHGNAGSFDIVTSQRVFELQAQTEEDARRWILAIQPHINSRSGSTIGTSNSFADKLSSSVIGGDTLNLTEKAMMRNAAPWCVEAVWLEGAEDVPLDITAHLGKLPEDRSFDARVRLSDGTTYTVDSKSFDLAGGHRREIAAAGVSKLFAQLVPADGTGGTASKEPARVSIVHEDVGQPAVSARTLMGLSAASFCCGGALGSLPSAVARRLGRRRLFALLLAAAGIILSRCWKDVRAAVRPKLKPPSPPRREPPTSASYNLVLRAITEISKEYTEMKERNSLNGSYKKPDSFLMRAASTQSAGAVPELPVGAVNFTGRWRLNVARSSDPSEMLKAIGVPWIARKALAGASRTVEIEQDGFLWTDTTTTAVITKTMSFSLDGVPYSEMSPVDRQMITMTSKFVDKGQCILTASTYSDGIRTQEVFRRLIDGGQTYHIHNMLTLGPEQVIESHSYFNRLS